MRHKTYKKRHINFFQSREFVRGGHLAPLRAGRPLGVVVPVPLIIGPEYLHERRHLVHHGEDGVHVHGVVALAEDGRAECGAWE